MCKPTHNFPYDKALAPIIYLSIGIEIIGFNKGIIDEPINHRLKVRQVVQVYLRAAFSFNNTFVESLHDVMQEVTQYSRIQFFLNFVSLFDPGNMPKIKFNSAFKVSVKRRWRDSLEVSVALVDLQQVFHDRLTFSNGDLRKSSRYNGIVKDLLLKRQSGFENQLL